MNEKLLQKNAELERENALLLARLRSFEAKTETLEEDKRTLEQEKEKLLAKTATLERTVEDLRRQLYGRRSERFEDPGQLQLFEQELAAEARDEIERSLRDTAEDTPSASKKKGPKKLSASLPREELVLDLAEDQKRCPHGGRWESFGVEVTQEVDIIPARLFVREIKRPKYRIRGCNHPECRGVKVADLPPRPIEQGRPAPGLLAHVAVSKFSDHLPLYRQAQIFERHGIDLHRSTLGDWLGRVGALLTPIVDEMKRDLLESPYLQADETSIRVQGLKQGKMHTGFLWGYGRPWAEVVYDFTLDRSHQRPLRFLERFRGTLLQADGYDGYNATIRAKKGQVTRLGCWAHVRRKFYDALNVSPDEAKTVLAAIQLLYRIERRLKDTGADPDERRRVRRAEAKPILDTLQELLDVYAADALPKGKLGKAIRYTQHEWSELTAYIDHGEAEIDNNGLEHTLRPVALGRKNFLFAGSPEGGTTAAVLYSLITSCKRLDVNPWEYLKDVIDRVSTHPMARIAELTPRGWQNARVQA